MAYEWRGVNPPEVPECPDCGNTDERKMERHTADDEGRRCRPYYTCLVCPEADHDDETERSE